MKWRAVYEGVARSNAVLIVLKKATLSDEKRKEIEGQARALRGFYHFEAKRLWNMVPYVDENSVGENVPNNRDIWPLIEDDFEFAWLNLPEVMGAVGRINKWVAAAFLAKVYMYQEKFAEALPLLNAILQDGRNALGTEFALEPRYGDVLISSTGTARKLCTRSSIR